MNVVPVKLQSEGERKSPEVKWKMQKPQTLRLAEKHLKENKNNIK